MRHKTDAKEQANIIIDKHKENGLSDEQAKNSAIITVNIILSNIRYGTITHSLFMRTMNYLESTREIPKVPKEERDGFEMSCYFLPLMLLIFCVVVGVVMFFNK